MLAAPGKVHGSNFSFETDGGQVRYYSRYKEVARSEKFIRKTCVEDAMGKYDAAVRRAFRLHSEAGARPIRSLRIYGEYFGGWYPAPGVAARGAGADTSSQATERERAATERERRGKFQKKQRMSTYMCTYIHIYIYIYM